MPLINIAARAAASYLPSFQWREICVISCSKPSCARVGVNARESSLRKFSTPSMTPAANSSRTSGKKSSRASALNAPLRAIITAWPGSAGGNNLNSPTPPSTKFCTPCSAAFKSSTSKRPRLVNNVMAVRDVTATPLLSTTRTMIVTGVLPSALAPELTPGGNSTRMFETLPGAVTLIVDSPRSLPNSSICFTVSVFAPGTRSTPTYSQACNFLSSITAFLPTRSLDNSLLLTESLKVVPCIPFTRIVVCA